MGYKVAIVGATGNVGREMLNILEEVSFQAPETALDVTVDGSYVEGRLGPLTEDREVRKYLL